MKARVLVVGSSRNSKSGITSVINAHTKGAHWGKYGMMWLGAHTNRGFFPKVLEMVKSYVAYIFIVYWFKIIHIHLSTPKSALRKLYFLIIAKLLFKKVIIHLHIGSQINMFTNSAIYRFVFRYSNLIIVLSNVSKHDLIDLYNVDVNKIKVLYNPSIINFIPKSSVNKEKQILYAGLISKPKGCFDLIKAFSKLPSNNENWKLVLAGSGEIIEAQQLINELQIRGSVIFTGWLGKEQLFDLYSKSSIFCFPSYFEGFPMAVIEAWDFKLPVICTPVGGLPDFIIDYENCLIVNPGDIDSLTAKLYELINSEDLRDKLSRNGNIIVKENFQIERISEKIDFIYSSLYK